MGAFLVDNHESKFEGGENQIVSICMEVDSVINSKQTSKQH